MSEKLSEAAESQAPPVPTSGAVNVSEARRPKPGPSSNIAHSSVGCKIASTVPAAATASVVVTATVTPTAVTAAVSFDFSPAAAIVTVEHRIILTGDTVVSRHAIATRAETKKD